MDAAQQSFPSSKYGNFPNQDAIFPGAKMQDSKGGVKKMMDGYNCVFVHVLCSVYTLKPWTQVAKLSALLLEDLWVP